jgi:hypothetical protein
MSHARNARARETGIALADAVRALRGCAQAADCVALELAGYERAAAQTAMIDTALATR